MLQFGLNDLIKLEKEAEAFGFKWHNTSQIIKQIESEVGEVKEQLLYNKNAQLLKEEISDLLHAVFSLSVHCDFSPQELIHMSVNKFKKRFSAVKDIASEQGLSTLSHLNFSELMEYWDAAKTKVG